MLCYIHMETIRLLLKHYLWNKRQGIANFKLNSREVLSFDDKDIYKSIENWKSYHNQLVGSKLFEIVLKHENKSKHQLQIMNLSPNLVGA